MPTCGETGFGYKKTKRNRISVFQSANRFPVYRLQHYSKVTDFASELLLTRKIKLQTSQAIVLEKCYWIYWERKV